MSDKQHKPSATRLRRAREKGDVPSSQEVPRAAGFVGVVVALVALVPRIVERIGVMLTEALRDPLRSDAETYGHAFARFMDLGTWAMVLAIPLAYMLAASAGAFFQTKGLISFAKLEPDINRINPAEGLKKIFSVRGLVNVARIFLKAALCGGALLSIIWALGESVAMLAFSEVSLVGPVAWIAIKRLLYVAAILYVASALFDIWFESYEFTKRNRMSHEEVKQENKDQYGDPHVRGERKSLQRESARSAGAKEAVEYAAIAIAGPGPVMVLIGFGKTPTGPALMLLKKARGVGVESLRAEVVRQSKPIVVDVRLSNGIHDRVAEKALVPEPMAGDVYSLLSQLPRG